MYAVFLLIKAGKLVGPDYWHNNGGNLSKILTNRVKSWMLSFWPRCDYLQHIQTVMVLLFERPYMMVCLFNESRSLSPGHYQQQDNLTANSCTRMKNKQGRISGCQAF